MNFTPTKWEMEICILSIQSLIKVDSYFENWEMVDFWKSQLVIAKAELDATYPA